MVRYSEKMKVGKPVQLLSADLLPVCYVCFCLRTGLVWLVNNNLYPSLTSTELNIDCPLQRNPFQSALNLRTCSQARIIHLYIPYAIRTFWVCMRARVNSMRRLCFQIIAIIIHFHSLLLLHNTIYSVLYKSNIVLASS